VTSAIKLSQGELRPHFLDICQPIRNGTPITFPCQTNEYIEYDTYSCVKPESNRLVRDARQSFPSGHTSTAFYYATFLIVRLSKTALLGGQSQGYNATVQIYLHARVAVHDRARMIPFIIIYAVLLIAATLVGISRIFDNKHHPIDVAAGQAIGIFIAASIVRHF
jgi:phosphatidate phosphatase